MKINLSREPLPAKSAEDDILHSTGLKVEGLQNLKVGSADAVSMLLSSSLKSPSIARFERLERKLQEHYNLKPRKQVTDTAMPAGIGGLRITSFNGKTLKVLFEVTAPVPELPN